MRMLASQLPAEELGEEGVIAAGGAGLVHRHDEETAAVQYLQDGLGVIPARYGIAEGGPVSSARMEVSNRKVRTATLRRRKRANEKPIL